MIDQWEITHDGQIEGTDATFNNTTMAPDSYVFFWSQEGSKELSINLEIVRMDPIKMKHPQDLFFEA